MNLLKFFHEFILRYLEINTLESLPSWIRIQDTNQAIFGKIDEVMCMPQNPSELNAKELVTVTAWIVPVVRLENGYRVEFKLRNPLVFQEIGTRDALVYDKNKWMDIAKQFLGNEGCGRLRLTIQFSVKKFGGPDYTLELVDVETEFEIFG